MTHAITLIPIGPVMALITSSRPLFCIPVVDAALAVADATRVLLTIALDTLVRIFWAMTFEMIP